MYIKTIKVLRICKVLLINTNLPPGIWDVVKAFQLLPRINRKLPNVKKQPKEVFIHGVQAPACVQNRRTILNFLIDFSFYFGNVQISRKILKKVKWKKIQFVDVLSKFLLIWDWQKKQFPHLPTCSQICICIYMPDTHKAILSLYIDMMKFFTHTIPPV